MRLLALGLAWMMVCLAGANTLDQYSPYTNTSFNMFTSSLHWQQEVVAGLPGPLVEVDLYVIAPGSCNFYITSGAPWQGGTPQWTTTFTSTTTGWVAVDTSAANLTFNPGDHFVLGFDGTDQALNLGGSYQPPDGAYPPGQLWLNQSLYVSGNFDVAFKTYVPEPVGVGLILLVFAFRRR